MKCLLRDERGISRGEAGGSETMRGKGDCVPWYLMEALDEGEEGILCNR